MSNTLLTNLKDSIVKDSINRDMVDRFAEQEQNESIQISNMVRGNLSNFEANDKPVFDALSSLKSTVDDINPNNFKLSFFDKIFGKANFMQKYFQKFQDNKELLSSIINKLDEGKQVLLNDNVALEIEVERSKELVKKLQSQLSIALEANEYVESILSNDSKSITTPLLESKNNTQEIQNATDSIPTIHAEVIEKELTQEKKLEIQNQILFPLKQKITDFQQQILVHTQGEIAIKTLINNNKELANSVDRTKSVTLNALNVAIIIAQGLDQQERVLKAVKDINTQTSELISQTSNKLKQQGQAIQEGAANAMLDMEKLKTAFDNVLEAMEATKNFKINALPKMQQNIELYNKYIEEMEAKKDVVMK